MSSSSSSTPSTAPSATSSVLAVHRCRFLDAHSAGVVASALHPNGGYLAVAREGGAVEVWSSSSSSSSSSSATPSSSSSLSAPPSISAATVEGAGWAVIASIPGTSAVSVRSACWAPLKSRSHPGVDGARLFLSSLDGRIYEADLQNLQLRPVAESNAGGVWCISAFDVTRVGGGASAGCVVAAGCEDGSVRLLRAETHEQALTHIVACPGTDGRILSLSWHPTLPVLFAGTAAGTIRGWDLSVLIQGVADAHGAAQAKRAAAAARAKARAKARAERAAAKAAGGSDSDSSDSSDSDSSDSSDDDDNNHDALRMDPRQRQQLQALEAASSLAATGGRGATVGPRAAVRMQLDSFGVPNPRSKVIHKPRLVWSVAVLNDLTVISGDSKGELHAWDGKTGTLISSVPLARAEGDILAVCAAEDSAGTVTVAAGGADGRVFVVSRAADVLGPPPPPDSAAAAAAASSSSASSASAARWVAVGTHSAHSAPIRCISVGVTGYGGPGTAVVVSGGADALLAVSRPLDLMKGGAPRILTPFGQGPRLVDIARTAKVLVAYQGASVQLYSVGASTAGAAESAPANVGEASRRAAADADAALLLQIDTPSLPAGGAPTSAALTDARRLPEADPAAVAISDDASWVCYASGGGRLPTLIHLQVEYEHEQRGGASSTTASGRRVKSITPSPVELPGRLAASLESHGGVTVSRLAFVGPYLLVIAGTRMHVCLCHKPSSASSSSASSSASASAVTAGNAGKKRGRGEIGGSGAAAGGDGEGEAEAEALFLYSLPIPHAHGAPVTIAAAGSGSVAQRDPRRARSATQESAGLEGAYDDDAAAAADGSSDEEDEDGGAAVHASSSSSKGGAKTKMTTSSSTAAGGGSSASSSSSFRSATNAVTLPLLLAGEMMPLSSSGRGALVALATTSRHVHVYRLSDASGQLSLTLPRMPARPTALCFSSGACALFVALRDASISVFDANTGRVAPWSPAPGDKAKLPKAFVSRVAMDPIRTLVALTPSSAASTSGSNGNKPAKVLAFGANVTISLSFEAEQGAAVAAATQAASSSKGKAEKVKGGSASAAADSAISSASSVTASISDRYGDILFAGPLGPRPSASTEGSRSAVSEAVVVEVPWRQGKTGGGKGILSLGGTGASGASGSGSGARGGNTALSAADAAGPGAVAMVSRRKYGT